MRQVEVRNPNAGECVEHPECFVEIWHPLSPCTSSLLLKSHSRKECRDDSERSEVMQAEREGEPLMPRPCFIWASQGRVSLPWEAKALDGLELPSDVVWSGYRERFWC